MTGSVKKLLAALGVVMAVGCAVTAAEDQLRMESDGAWMNMDVDDAPVDLLGEGELSLEEIMQLGDAADDVEADDDEADDDVSDWEDEDLASLEAMEELESQLSGVNAIFNCPGGKIALQADTGRYLSRCRGCASSNYQDSATLHVTSIAGHSTWTVVPVGGDSVAFQSGTGQYLARCSKCMRGASYPETAFVYATSPSTPRAVWRVVSSTGGKVALMSDSGRYLARCNHCAPGSPPDRAFVHGTSPNQSPAQWTPVCLGQSEKRENPENRDNAGNGENPFAKCSSGRVALRADTGKYLTRCINCESGPYRDSATVHGESKSLPLSQWQVTVLPGNKVALKGDSGLFLSRCRECIRASYLDSALVYGSSSSLPPTQWEWELLSNGHVTLRADTGMYLTRCRNCGSGPYDHALVFGRGPAIPPMQWAVECA